MSKEEECRCSIDRAQICGPTSQGGNGDGGICVTGDICRKCLPDIFGKLFYRGYLDHEEILQVVADCNLGPE